MTVIGIVREVVKYCTKLTEVDATEREDGTSDVLLMHRAIRGRRLLVTTFRGLKEPQSEEDLLEDPASRPCVFCGAPWETVTAVWVEQLDRYVVRWTPPWAGGKAPPPTQARPSEPQPTCEERHAREGASGG